MPSREARTIPRVVDKEREVKRYSAAIVSGASPSVSPEVELLFDHWRRRLDWQGRRADQETINVLKERWPEWVCSVGFEVRVDLTYDVSASVTAAISRKTAFATLGQWHGRLAASVSGPVLMLACLERQQKGTWHWHCLLERTDSFNLYLPAGQVWATWRDYRGKRRPRGIEGRCEVIYLRGRGSAARVRYVTKYVVKEVTGSESVYLQEVVPACAKEMVS